MPKKLNLRELLNFFDSKVITSIGHASAINGVIGEDLGVALLYHYFLQQKLNPTVLDEPCTQKTVKGKRLDKWIAVNNEDIKIIYQVEIKNWNAHSLDSEIVKDHDDEEYMRDFRIRRWQKRFDTELRIPKQSQCQKVLLQMKVPSGYEDFNQKPLLCFWEALHEEGKSDAFFEVDVKSEIFESMAVFSMSNYVSELLKQTKFLDINLSDVKARINWLNRIYS